MAIWRNAAAGTAMQPAVTWIGHATMLVQASGLNVLTDPVFSARVSPVQFAGPSRAQPRVLASIGQWSWTGGMRTFMRTWSSG